MSATVPSLVAQRGKTAKLVTSACTGSTVLGAAGFLRVYKATSQGSPRDILPQLEAELAVNLVVQAYPGCAVRSQASRRARPCFNLFESGGWPLSTITGGRSGSPPNDRQPLD
jgi:putative intracellular protease/amidase